MQKGELKWKDNQNPLWWKMIDRCFTESRTEIWEYETQVSHVQKGLKKVWKIMYFGFETRRRDTKTVRG